MGNERSLWIPRCLGILVFWLATAAYVQASVFTVNTNVDFADANLGNGVCDVFPPNNICTLRAAIQETNALAGTDQIILPALPAPNAYVLTLVTELTITTNLTITGGGASNTIIDGNKAKRPNNGVLTIDSPAAVSISGVTIRNGATQSGGGAIVNVGTLTLTNSTVSGNSTSGSGGGIWNNGTVNLFNATITDNLADADRDLNGAGGGVFVSGGTFNFRNTILAGNSRRVFDAVSPRVPRRLRGDYQSTWQ